jgi:uncharacterized protein (TIGR00661 family)
MTQALAVRQMLCRSGHELVGAVIGTNGTRPVPPYVAQGLSTDVIALPSPGFVLRHGRGVDMPGTVRRAVTGSFTWRSSIRALRRIVHDTRPDVILNFFEPLTALAQTSSGLAAPVVSVAHQHMIGHPAHRSSMAGWAGQKVLQLYGDIVAGRSWKLALSLYPAHDLPDRRIMVSPPLLRRQIFDMRSTEGDFYLVYLLNHGYHEEIRRWHVRNPGTRLRCFYDRPGAPVVERVDANLTFHRLDGERFLQYMAQCRALVSTAGFESVSEAAWFGKPMLLVPVEGHAEQRWNARDAQQAGLACTTSRFDLDLLASVPRRVENGWFRDWVARAEATLGKVIDLALNGGPRAP